MDPTENTPDPQATPTPDSNSLLDGAENVQLEGDTGAPPAEDANPDRLDFVLDRYRAEGRSEQDAALEQAKGYNEIRKQLGGFTGAPDDYAYKIPDEMIEKGVSIAEDDPLMEKAKSMAKEMNMSQEGFDQMVNMFIETQLYEIEALKGQRDEQLKSLGPTGPQRLAGINQYINANFDEETVSYIQDMVTTAESVKAIEALIRAGRNAPVAPTESPPAAPQVTKEEVEQMLFATTETGQRRINVDPEFKAEYERKRNLLWGTDPHRTIVNG